MELQTNLAGINGIPADLVKRVLGREMGTAKPGADRIISGIKQRFGLPYSDPNTKLADLPYLLPDAYTALDESTKQYDWVWQSLKELSKLSAQVPSEWYEVQGNWVPLGDTVATEPHGTVCLDIETAPYDGLVVPTVACVIGLEGAWLWVNSSTAPLPLVPLNGCLVTGFNVTGYDRGFIRDEYLSARPAANDRGIVSGNLWFDVQAAWIAARGFTNQQRGAYLASEKNSYFTPEWVGETAPNSLAAVYSFYTGEDLDKGVRDSIIKYGFEWTMSNLDDVIRYCFMDVVATIEVLGWVYPEWLKLQPSPVSRVGQLLLGSTWLPLADNWQDWHHKVESDYKARKQSITDSLTVVFDELKDRYFERTYLIADLTSKLPKAEREDYMRGLLSTFMEQLPEQHRLLDWTPALTGKTKGTPLWYRKNKEGLTLDKQVVPLVLQIALDDEPILWDAEDGGFYTRSGRLEHPEGPHQRIMTLFIKGFDNIEWGTLSDNEIVAELLALKQSTAVWKSIRKRVIGARVHNLEGFPVTIPQNLVTGTVSRRSADPLWQVAPNAKPKKIGTEVRCMIRAPKGYVVLGADQDSQEMWLAATMADKQLGLGVAGADSLSYTVSVGDKDQGTDPHSLNSKATMIDGCEGVNRDDVKPLGFGSLYGSGLSGKVKYLTNVKPSWAPELRKTVAQAFSDFFEGVKNPKTGLKEGGLASQFFAYAEYQMHPRTRTLMLGAYQSKALSESGTMFKPSRVNWHPQSSGVDMRDAWVALVSHYFTKAGIEWRLLLTVHDELRLLVKEEQAILGALLLQNIHLAIRGYILAEAGLDIIPVAVAYHSAIDIDVTWRKSPDKTCQTPTFDGLPPGKAIKPHELAEMIKSVDLTDIVLY